MFVPLTAHLLDHLDILLLVNRYKSVSIRDYSDCNSILLHGGLKASVIVLWEVNEEAGDSIWDWTVGSND